MSAHEIAAGAADGDTKHNYSNATPHVMRCGRHRRRLGTCRRTRHKDQGQQAFASSRIEPHHCRSPLTVVI